jgi:glycosyltransferase involved in cell wall biosynthesis
VKPPKVLAVVSSVDLTYRYGCTPAWWQLWKGLYEAGIDLIVTPYRGRAIESPWWRTYENPCYREGEAFARARDLAVRLRGDTHIRRAESSPEDSRADRIAREVIWRWVTPRWQAHLARILERERDVAAVVVFTVPVSHLRGVPTALRGRFGVPVVYYDADVPMSLPEFGGMDTGFNIYHGADPAEFDLFLSNSEGGLPRLRELGARRAEALFWGADPELFAPLPVEKEYDVSFYAYGDKFRRDWMQAMVGEPSRRLPEVDFVLGGRDFRGDTGRARQLGDVQTNVLSRLISQSRVNLNLVRKPHATVPFSSTSRLFELAAAGAAIVCSPYEGVERWFEPGAELRIVHSADEAVETYRELLGNPLLAAELGRRARERVLAEHTFVARARRLLDLVGVPSL